MGRMGKLEWVMAKKKRPMAENLRSKEVLYWNWSAFLYCTVVTLGDPWVFSESTLYTTMSIRSALKNKGWGHWSILPGAKGNGESEKGMDDPNC